MHLFSPIKQTPATTPTPSLTHPLPHPINQLLCRTAAMDTANAGNGRRRSSNGGEVRSPEAPVPWSRSISGGVFHTTQHNTTHLTTSSQHITTQHHNTTHLTTSSQHNSTHHNSTHHNTSSQHNSTHHNTSSQHITTQHTTPQHNTPHLTTSSHHITPQHNTPHLTPDDVPRGRSDPSTTQLSHTPYDTHVHQLMTHSMTTTLYLSPFYLLSPQAWCLV